MIRKPTEDNALISCGQSSIIQLDKLEFSEVFRMSRFSEKGYVVDSVKVMVDSNYENIEKIEIVLCKSNNISIEPINIGEDKIVQEDIELKNFISEKYQIDIDKVFVFQN